MIDDDPPGTPSRPVSAAARPSSPGPSADAALTSLNNSRPGTADNTDKIPSPSYYDDTKTKFAHRWVIPPFGSVQFKGARASLTYLTRHYTILPYPTTLHIPSVIIT